MGFKRFLQQTWHFLWHDDSIASWAVNLILAFVIVKFLLYPGFGLLLSTQYPIVAVVSGSMEHDTPFDQWWDENKYYEQNGITKEAFESYRFKNGFDKGDIMLIKGVTPKNIKRGDVIVYENSDYNNPIIHRVVDIEHTDDYAFTTKGDNNRNVDRTPVAEEQIAHTGKAIVRIPFLGWIKIWFVNLFGLA